MDFINKFENIKIPKKLISKYPRHYTEVKLMIFNRIKKKIIHDKLYNIYKYFNKNDIIIGNNSKTYPIKYNCYKNITNNISNIETYLLKELNPIHNIWDILVNPARKIRLGNKIYFKYKTKKRFIEAEIIDNTTSKGRLLKFITNKDNITLKKNIFKFGKFLLHKNIIKNKNINIKFYQNSYAKKIGSTIFPTSGAYFHKNILLNLKLHNIKFLKITLHLNFNKYFNFNIKTLSKYKNLNSEQLFIKKKVIKTIKKYLKRKKSIKLCALGSNTLRAIENIIYDKNILIPYKGYINKMFNYGYKYKFINSLITYFNEFDSINFISLLNLCGINNVYNIYKEAIKFNYNFFTYGDLLLII
ncbi:MAG: S-adenosylmethionine:tRNA ribosyltransferase-isomerase [Candidatus Shikimatogenerans bostrichidophilus]|nr:MAG: S-adenosylmethionine:tRNA ribosyltransferase-isomerase [Candidatus Shikimatogenerans bostrichidophilus]